MPPRGIRHRLAYLYAILTGIIGLFILVRLFMQQTLSIDLETLLAFSLTAVIVSYFRVPLGESVEQVLGVLGRCVDHNVQVEGGAGHAMEARGDPADHQVPHAMGV